MGRIKILPVAFYLCEEVEYVHNEFEIGKDRWKCDATCVHMFSWWCGCCGVTSCNNGDCFVEKCEFSGCFFFCLEKCP